MSGVRRAVAQTSTLQLQQLQAHLREREKEHLQQTRQTSNIFANQKVVSKSLTSTTTTLTTTNNSLNQNNSQINQVLDLPNIFESMSMNRDSRFLLSR